MTTGLVGDLAQAAIRKIDPKEYGVFMGWGSIGVVGGETGAIVYQCKTKYGMWVEQWSARSVNAAATTQYMVEVAMDYFRKRNIAGSSAPPASVLLNRQQTVARLSQPAATLFACSATNSLMLPAALGGADVVALLDVLDIGPQPNVSARRPVRVMLEEKGEVAIVCAADATAIAGTLWGVEFYTEEARAVFDAVRRDYFGQA